MNGGDKWRMVGAQDKTVINPIMLRFRPIAPKPVTGESGSDGIRFDNKNVFLSKPRAKRKYVRVRKNNMRRKKKSPSDQLLHHDDEASNNPETIVTLKLLPEKSEANGSINYQNSIVFEENYQIQDPLYLFNNRWVDRLRVVGEPDRTVLMSRKGKVMVVESWVTVESVIDSCMELIELESTDVERIKNLEADTCPGFISDGLNRVQWVNGAYKSMLMVDDGDSPEITVWLVFKEDLPRFCTAFSCRVRLQYTWQNEKYSRMLPCDVWKMEGGFVWRLDIEAALSLGR